MERVTVDRRLDFLEMLTVIKYVVESSPGVRGYDGFTHCVGWANQLAEQDMH